jgi:hypothetical protein
MESYAVVAEDTLTRLVERADVAADLYTIYMIALLVLGVPLTLHRGGLQMRCVGLLNGVTKPLFVALFLSVWWAYDVINTLMATVDWRAYWWNLYHDPCFLDPLFLAAKAQVPCPRVSESRIAPTLQTLLQ